MAVVDAPVKVPVTVSVPEADLVAMPKEQLDKITAAVSKQLSAYIDSMGDTFTTTTQAIQEVAKYTVLSAAPLKSGVTFSDFKMSVPLIPDWKPTGLTRKSKAEVRTMALDAVNMLREEYNMPPLTELPQGKRRSPRDCVIARALADVGAAVAQPDYIRFRGGQGHPTPPAIREFMSRFDDGHYHDLIARSKPMASKANTDDPYASSLDKIFMTFAVADG